MLLENMLVQTPDEALIYLEQKVNYLFQDYGERISSVALEYQPEEMASFALPYVELDEHWPELNYYEVAPDENIRALIRNKSKIEFFVHPEMISEYQARGLTALTDIKGSWQVKPTASTRTVMTVDQPINMMLKVNMTKPIGGVVRKLKLSAVRHSHKVMSELAGIESENISGFAYLPESIGMAFGDDIGLIVRENQARPKIADRRYLVPFFSLISMEKGKRDWPLLRQIMERQAEKPLEALRKYLVQPLLQGWSWLVFGRGIIPVLHLQNCLLEVDAKGKPTRVVCRDLMDGIVDRITRERIGANCEGFRHIIADREHFQINLDGVIETDSKALRSLQYGISYDFWLGVMFYCWQVVMSCFPDCHEQAFREMIKDCFEKIIPDQAKELFPIMRYRVSGIIPEDSRIRMIETVGTPIYR